MGGVASPYSYKGGQRRSTTFSEDSPFMFTNRIGARPTSRAQVRVLA